MFKYKYDIQFFNENNSANVETVEESNEQPKDLLTQEQVNEIISKRLSKEKIKFEKEYNKKLEIEKAEVQRLATMNAEQRQQEELKKKIKELEEREQALRKSEAKSEAIEVLRDRGLSVDFVDIVLGDSDEVTLNNINLLEKVFKNAIELEVENRIPTYKHFSVGTGDKGSHITKEEFKALPLSKQNELYMSNKDLYKEYF